MNHGMIELSNEWTNNQWVYERVNERKNEWKNERMNEWLNG